MNIRAGLVCLLSAVGISAEAGEALCLYYLDSKDGHLYRSELDGSRKELVIRSAATGKRGPTLASTLPNAKTRGSLHLAGLPSGDGFTVVDGAKPGPYVSFRVPSGPSVFAQPGHWQARYDTRSVSIEPGHKHDVVTGIRVWSGGRKLSHALRTAGKGGLVALLSGSRAVIQDGDDVMLWDLGTNKVRTVVRAKQAVVWPRSLARAERFKPEAKLYLRQGLPGLPAGTYRWKLRDASDVRAKPEYLARRL